MLTENQNPHPGIHDLRRTAGDCALALQKQNEKRLQHCSRLDQARRKAAYNPADPFLLPDMGQGGTGVSCKLDDLGKSNHKHTPP